ncbi:hypothetical protein [Burkholderia gladioli]|uniref:hypothetical protein n=1 Tax=Burkholderia gladioli TaxID=28095 RepID=UPI0015E741A7|nr:hypothetical protein [Burkholderia gladioli]MBA1363799.1 hypothetical protein [Burkholderia gladioli]
MSRALARSTRDGIERGIFDSNQRGFVLRKTFANFVEFSDLHRIPGEIRIFKKPQCSFENEGVCNICKESQRTRGAFESNR